MVLLCRRHHRSVHQEGFRVTLDASGDVRFLRPDGRPLAEAPAAPAWAGPALGPTNDWLAAAGIEIDARTATPAWQGERLDLGWALSVLWRGASGAQTDARATRGPAPRPAVARHRTGG